MGGPDSQGRKRKCVRVLDGSSGRERDRRKESGDKCQPAISPPPNLAIFLRKCQIELVEPSYQRSQKGMAFYHIPPQRDIIHVKCFWNKSLNNFCAAFIMFSKSRWIFTE